MPLSERILFQESLWARVRCGYPLFFHPYETHKNGLLSGLYIARNRAWISIYNVFWCFRWEEVIGRLPNVVPSVCIWALVQRYTEELRSLFPGRGPTVSSYNSGLNFAACRILCGLPIWSRFLWGFFAAYSHAWGWNLQAFKIIERDFTGLPEHWKVK